MELPAYFLWDMEQANPMHYLLPPALWTGSAGPGIIRRSPTRLVLRLESSETILE
jgi:hypothetical protein